MNEEASGLPVRPPVRPADARFSSGPCKKYPGWDLSHLNTEFLGRSHRAKLPKQRLRDAIDRSHALLGLPADWLGHSWCLRDNSSPGLISLYFSKGSS
jgi:hypothetical protein